MKQFFTKLEKEYPRIFDLLIVCIITLIIFGVMLSMSACNKQIMDLNYMFTKAYMIDSVETIEISQWTDYDQSDMIQFKDKDGNVYLTHSSNVILIGR